MKLYIHSQVDIEVADIEPKERFNVINSRILEMNDEKLIEMSRKLKRRKEYPRERIPLLIGLDAKAREKIEKLKMQFPESSLSALFYRILYEYKYNEIAE